MRKLRKGWLNFLIITNILILTSLGNNPLLTDFILLIIFSFNSKILLKFGGF